ncbi:(d)CMP kinase [Rhodobacteraceae bacterium NNCM2]|nr:(d)CMP kinase [Coraliihabitans acroporae]
MPFTVAIDGPAAAGKGTIARAVAKRFGFAHLDTGLLYRAVGKRAIDEGGGAIEPAIALRCAEQLSPEDLKADQLRSAEVGQAASKVAAMPDVRAALLDFQRRFAATPSGAVLDGRDIGTVICPDADVKLYVTANDDVRAERRAAELNAKGEAMTVAEVLADLKARDARDSARADAPLTRADDALLLDTSELAIDAAVAEAVAIIEQAMSGARR